MFIYSGHIYVIYESNFKSKHKGTEFLPQTMTFQTLFSGSRCCRPLIFQTIENLSLWQKINSYEYKIIYAPKVLYQIVDKNTIKIFFYILLIG